jgi:hypothetical protein
MPRRKECYIERPSWIWTDRSRWIFPLSQLPLGHTLYDKSHFSMDVHSSLNLGMKWTIFPASLDYPFWCFLCPTTLWLKKFVMTFSH